MRRSPQPVIGGRRRILAEEALPSVMKKVIEAAYPGATQTEETVP